MALLALAASSVANRPGLRRVLLLLGVFGAALFYGDGVITPAISVLSAMEGLRGRVAATLALCRRADRRRAGRCFSCHPEARHRRHRRTVRADHGDLVHRSSPSPRSAPIANHPSILAAHRPRSRASRFLIASRLGRVRGARLGGCSPSTGAEALYADMGHFGARPIRMSWFLLVLPALALNYLGQGALLAAHPEAIENPVLQALPTTGRCCRWWCCRPLRR